MRQTRIQRRKPAKPVARPDLDLRTPSGRVLPF
jgi:hypothetical protein